MAAKNQVLSMTDHLRQRSNELSARAPAIVEPTEKRGSEMKLRIWRDFFRGMIGLILNDPKLYRNEDPNRAPKELEREIVDNWNKIHIL